MTRYLIRVVLPALLALAPAGGCIRVKSDPVRVEPIEINVTVRVKVDRELDDFFDDLDRKDTTIEATD